jgi:hypothetical protein
VARAHNRAIVSAADNAPAGSRRASKKTKSLPDPHSL